MYNFISTVNTIFLSILLQAIPFMLIGSMLSAILHVFVSDTFVVKVFPNKSVLGFITALFGGVCLPVCECACVPIVSGLIRKGVSMPAAITFMLAAPIVNPISIMSTVYAFPDNPFFAFYRVFFGIITAASIGLILLFYPKTEYFKSETSNAGGNHFDHTHCCSCCKENSGDELNFLQKLKEVFLHIGSEFFSVGKYLIIGALVTAIIRVGIPADFFIKFTSGNSNIGVAIMMLFAFLFSACSTSDAFIARGFSGNVSLFSIMGFLVFGPMMDIKNIFMLLSFFKKRFVVELVIIITVINFIVITALGFIFL